MAREAQDFALAMWWSEVVDATHQQERARHDSFKDERRTELDTVCELMGGEEQV